MTSSGYLVSTDRDDEQQRWYFVLDNGTLSWSSQQKVRFPEPASHSWKKREKKKKKKKKKKKVCSSSLKCVVQGTKLGELDATRARFRGMGLLFFEVLSADGLRLILSGESRADSARWLEALRSAKKVAPRAVSGPRVTVSTVSPTRDSGGGWTAPKSPRESGRSPRDSGTVSTPKSPRFSLFTSLAPSSPRSGTSRIKSGNFRGGEETNAAASSSSSSQSSSKGVSMDCPDHYGWMSKKGSDRWFLLRDHVLYWFTKEQPLDTDIRKEIRGSQSLENCTVAPMQQDSFTLTSPVGVSYLLVCRSARERDEWVRVIENAMRDLERLVLADAKRSGWLEKKKQRRWFVLQELTLAWYVKEGDARERGQLNLADYNVVEDDPKTFTLVNVKDDQIRYQLVAKSSEEAKEWINSIRRASKRAQEKEADVLKARATARQNAEARRGGQVTMEKKGWFVKKRKRRFYVLRNTVLMWFVNETDVGNNATMKGSLEMTDCVATARGFDLHVRTKEGVVYILTATRKQDVDDWVNAIKDACVAANGGGAVGGSNSSGGVSSGGSGIGSNGGGAVRASVMVGGGAGGFGGLESKRGWAVKKGKRRFLVLRAGELLYFDKEQSGSGEPADKPKGSIRLATASANEINSNSFLVRSEGSTEGWVFETPESGAWVKALTAFINLASSSGELSHSGWMVKKGKRRWFALKKGLLMWFTEVQAQADAANANGSLLLKRCRIVEDAKTKTIVITPHAEMNAAPLEVVCYTAQELSDWYAALKGGQADASQTTMVDPFASTGTGLVFGRPIAEVLAREKTEVPNIVTVCCDYLREVALEHPGIFRLSGSAASINKLRDAFDAGESVNFAEEEVDLDNMAGLLKLYIRQLPEPPLTFNLYKDFLAAHDNPTALKELVKRLPKQCLDFTVYLLDFMCEIASLSERNQMTPSNISIVMGPNLLRQRDGEGDLVSNLKETPLMLSCCKNLVANWADIRP